MKRCPYCEDQFFNEDNEYENHLRVHESGMKMSYGSSSTPASAWEEEKHGGEKKRVLACKFAKKHFKVDAVLRNTSKRRKRCIIVKNVRKNFVISLICQNICARIMSSLKMRSILIWQIQYVRKRVSNLLRGIEMKLVATTIRLFLAQRKGLGIQSWIDSFR